jgi:serine/threonine protein kinase
MSSATTNACPRCLKAIAPGTKFCSSCGLDISGVWGMDAALGGTVAVEFDSNVDTLGQLLGEATLGEYDIYGELGRGGMAAVYLGLDLALNRKVAIKTMLPELVAKEGMVQRFKREAQTAAALSHPHITQIYTVKERGKLVYFVMKFIEGRSLESVITDKGPVALEMAQVLLNQVGTALAYAHRKGVVHRDIKPANIMIDEDGCAIVTDFGIAKVQEAQTSLTATGTAIGTPHYMSPEQFHNKAVTGASDQYSLGIVAYEMFTGKKPFDGATYAEIITQHLFEPVPDLRQFRTDIPDNIAEVVNKMMAKDPAERFPDLDAATHALGSPATKTEGEVVRTQMISLAKSGPQKKLRMSVPMSPIPVTKKAPTVARTVVERRPAPTRNRAMLWASLSVIGVLALGGGGYAVLQMGKPTSLTGVEQQSQAATPPAGAPQPLAAPVDSVPAVGTPGTDPAVARADSIARARAAAARRDSIRITRAAEQRLSRPAATKTAPPVAGRPDGARARGLSTLRLILSPPATVFIDGQSKGQQSRVVDELLPGLHTLRIEREGWIAKDTTVTLTAGQISTIRIQLSERRP